MVIKTPTNIYQKIINIIGEMVQSNNIDSLTKNTHQALKQVLDNFFFATALWDKYEEEMELFLPEDANKEFLTRQFKAIINSKSTKQFEEYAGNAIFEKSVTIGGESFFYEKMELENGVCGIFFIEFPNSDIKTLFSLFAGEIIPQFWSIFKERYQKKKVREESELLWSIKKAQMMEENFLNNIKLNQLLENLLTLALHKTKEKCGCILLLNEKTGELEFEPRAVKGKAVSNIPEKLSLNKKSIVGTVVKTNKPYISNDIEQDENYYPMFQNIKSSLAIPIKFQNRCIGVIALESEDKNSFTEQNVKEITSLSEAATMFIRRAQLYKETAKTGSGIMIFGRSAQWKQVEKKIEKASRTDATVMLRGESGTGKELLANAIYFNSTRKDKPFVTLNCAAIPSELLESEMFGHVKGAFTGATYDKIGEFEKADGGTIFLDEIGDLPLMLQVKLLRTLQNGEIKPVGSNKAPKKVDVRVIAATSRNLEQMIEEGTFRADMYYRLHVVPIKIPPLREYKEDIPYLISNFIKEANSKFKTHIAGIEDDALKILQQYDFPGNVRQLRNFVQQAVIMADESYIKITDLPEELQNIEKTETTKVKTVESEIQNTEISIKPYNEMKEEVLSRFNKAYFRLLFEKTKGNIASSAKIADISRVAIYKIMKKYNIESFKS